MPVIDMSKNQKISMTKEDGTAVKNIFIGARWDMNKYAGESDVDFDIHGFLTNADRKVQYPKDIVNYNTYEDGSTYPWIEFSGDNRTGDLRRVLNSMENTLMNILLSTQINSQQIEPISQFALPFSEQFKDYRILVW